MRYLLDDCRLDLDRGQVLRNDGEVFELSQLEREFLTVLIEAKGRVVSAAELMERVWGWKPKHIEHTVASGHRLPVTFTAHRVRNKIERVAANPAHLITCRGMGWRLDQVLNADSAPPVHVRPATTTFTPWSTYAPQRWIARPREELDGHRRLGPGSPLVVMGPRGAGKSWLCARIVQGTMQPGDRLVSISLDSPHRIRTREPDRFMLDFAVDVAEQLNLDDDLIASTWERVGTGTRRMSRYMREHVLPTVSGNLYLLIDPADALTQHGPVPNELFSMLRQWLDGARREPWDKLRVVMAVSMDPILLTTEFRISPFNLAPPVKAGDLDVAQVGELLAQHNLTATTQEASSALAWVGGSPALLRLLAAETAGQGMSVSRYLAQPLDEQSALHQYCEERLTMLRANPELGVTLSELLRGQAASRVELADRLVSAGLLVRDGQRHRISCALYASFFQERL